MNTKWLPLFDIAINFLSQLSFKWVIFHNTQNIHRKRLECSKNIPKLSIIWFISTCSNLFDISFFIPIFHNRTSQTVKMHIKIPPRTLGPHKFPYHRLHQSRHFSISIRSFGISLNSVRKIGAYQKARFSATRDAICGRGVKAKGLGELRAEIPISDIRSTGSIKRSAGSYTLRLGWFLTCNQPCVVFCGVIIVLSEHIIYC